MKRSIVSAIAVAACGSAPFLLAVPAFADSFAIADGQTVTRAQTLTDGETGAVAQGGALSLPSSNDDPAITLDGETRIDNAGSVGTTGDARAIDGDDDVALDLVNEAGAVISSVQDDALKLHNDGDSATIDNAGTIRSGDENSAGGQAIDFNDVVTGQNTVTNEAGATIEAYGSDAVRPGENGGVDNAGTIESINVASDDSGNDGVDAQANSGVTVANETGGAIEGARHGITGGNTDTDTDGSFRMTVTNAAGATIEGDDGSGVNIDGFNDNELVTVNNAGTISGDGRTGDGDGVDVDGLVDLTNSGTIVSKGAYDDNSEGVTVGGGTIVNSGLIEGDTQTDGASRGITLGGIDKDPDTDAPFPTQGIYADTSVDNAGTIRGQTGSAINVAGQGNDHTLTITNEAGGVLSGGGGEAAVFTGANDASLTNAGTIEATGSGAAVDLGSGDSRLAITGGDAVVDGDIDGGSGDSTLDIEPGSSNTFTYDDDIANFDTLETGAGTTILDGQSSNLGATTVDSGTLIVGDDDHAEADLDSDIALADGATLGGIGTVGSVTVGDSATVAPGNSIGTLRIDRDITFAAGSTLAVEVDGSNSDTLHVGGTANLDGGSVAIAGTLTPGITYTLIDADAIAGEFASVTGGEDGSGWLFLDPELGYSDQSVTLSLARNGTSFASVAATDNQRSVAGSLATLADGNILKQSVSMLASKAAARGAYDSLSGEAYASEQTAWFNDSRYIRDAVAERGLPDCADRPASPGATSSAQARSQADPCHGGAWGQAVGDWGHWDGNGTTAGLDHRVAGAFAGADRAIGSARIGLVAGLTHANSSVEAGRGSRIKTDNYELGVYADQQFGALGAQLGVAYAYHDANAHRDIAFTGTTANADYHGHTEQAFGGLGYAMNFGDATRLTPFARAAYIKLSTDAFDETGAGAANLEARGQDRSYGETHLGFALDQQLGEAGASPFAARLQLGWQHVIGTTTPTAELSFADGSSDFDESGVAITRNAGRVRAGLSARLSPNTRVQIDYQGQFGDGVSINGLRAKMTF